ncbi:lipopolysaccharide transport periplasmic protein LptA [Pigmentiphaga aceris]|uniref:Lipopolysaccharide export system protein LptA n=1 Tax=Pigmentiphaga aceris TaxID=1940612 RepID=A0A5C0B9A8_9BURK|nr:lipopolysaccharide transport periplasmic protein LptA [Pigmentiphaga aceris]
MLLAALLGLAAVPAFAERADRDKPTLIDSDTLQYDDVRQVSVFTGNVVLTKGTLIIRSDRMELREDAEGYQTGIATANKGKQVFVRQKREGVEEYTEGTSNRTEYEGKTERIFFIDQALVKRLACGVVQDEIRGQVVIYDQRTETYSAQGGPRSPQANQRVRTVIQSKTAGTTEAPSGPPATACPPTASTAKPAAGAAAKPAAPAVKAPAPATGARQ